MYLILAYGVDMKIETKCSQCFTSLIRSVSKTGNYFCNKRCKGDWQTSQRERLGFTREWLVDQYVTLGKSSNQIAREIGRDPKRVWEWIRDYGIETRPRGSDYGNVFKKGQESAFKGKKHTKETRELFRNISLKDGRVPYLKEGKHWLHHEGAISPAWQGGITPDRQAVYASIEWMNAVKAVWRRDDATCQRCKTHHNKIGVRGTFHIHHIVSFKVKEFRTDPKNLVLLCADCHRWVHGKENTDRLFIEEKK